MEDVGKDEIDYEVGYKKPPPQHQFQPGHKKAKGRRKGSRNIRTIFMEEAFAEIPHLHQGKKRKASAMRLIFRRLRNSALEGDEKAIIAMVNLGFRIVPPPEEEQEIPELTAAERAMFEALAAKKAVLEEGDA